MNDIFRTPRNTGYEPANPDSYGELEQVYALTIHHSAGPRAHGPAQAARLHRAYQQEHINKGWGDIAYHYALDDNGDFYTLRPRKFKGAHTEGHNTGNLGLLVHGNYDEDELTRAQKGAIKWLFRGGLHKLTQVSEAELSLLRGHREWPGNNTRCPGDHLMRHLAWRRGRETW